MRRNVALLKQESSVGRARSPVVCQATAQAMPGGPGGSRVLAAAGVFSMLVLALGLVMQCHPGDDALARARTKGVIRIGYAVEAPYAFLSDEGRVTGEAPEIARVIASRLGIPRVDWRLTEFGALIEGLDARRFDVIAAGMFITPERLQRVNFSVSTFQVGPGLLVRRGNPHGLHAHADLVGEGSARTAVLDASAEEALLLRLGCPPDRRIRVPDAASGRAAVRSGQADALALSAPAIRWMDRNPIAGETEMAAPFENGTRGGGPPREAGAFAFRKGEHALLEAWDAELARFVGSEEHRRLAAAFGFAADELPRPAPQRQDHTVP